MIQHFYAPGQRTDGGMPIVNQWRKTKEAKDSRSSLQMYVPTHTLTIIVGEV